MRAEIRELFHSLASGRSAPESVDLFCEEFLSLDPISASVVDRAQLAAALPARARMFASIQADGMALVDLDEDPIDDRHTWVRTAWQVRFRDGAADPLSVRASYLLRLDGGQWRIAVYLNHADIAALVRERAAGGGRQPGPAPRHVTEP